MENALLPSIPQLPYHTLYRLILSWLLTLNRRHLRVSLSLVAAYVAGLLWVRGAATCTAIAVGGRFTHDALNRLLIGPCLRGLLQMVALSLIDRRTGYLIIDDVLLDKEGKLMEGIHKLRDSKKRYVWAYNAVVLAWTDGRVVIPLSYRVWKPARTRNAKKQPSFDTYDGKLFRTKIQLATDLLQWAKDKDFTPRAVLFDAYYLNRDVLKFLKKATWEWVSCTKTNRNLKWQGKTYKPLQWQSLTGSITPHLPDWGTVRLLKLPPRRGEKARHLVGSNPNWSRSTIVRLYSYRWRIEELFRAGKQIASLNDCQCRTWQAQHNHIALAFVAYTFLVSQQRKRETPGQALKRLQKGEVIPLPEQKPGKVRPLRWDGIPKPRKHVHEPLCA